MIYKPKSINILLIEDDAEEVDMMLEIIELSSINIQMEVCSNGREALNYCIEKLQNPYELPHLILLDLNMPLMDGHEFMEEIKSHEHLKLIPVLVITTSEADLDINKSYSSGVSCYITKPTGVDQYQELFEALSNFWFRQVKFPNLESTINNLK